MVSKNIGEELGIQKICIDYGFPDKTRNLYIRDRVFVNHIKLLSEISISGIAFIVLKETQQDEFELKAVEHLNVVTGLTVYAHRIFCLVDLPGKIKKDDDIPSLIIKGSEWLFQFLREISEAVGENAEVKTKWVENEGYRADTISISIFRKLIE